MAHCCVPGCLNDVRYVENEAKEILFFGFPSDKNEKKEWIIKIRRDEGKYFQVLENC